MSLSFIINQVLARKIQIFLHLLLCWFYNLKFNFRRMENDIQNMIAILKTSDLESIMSTIIEVNEKVNSLLENKVGKEDKVYFK